MTQHGKYFIVGSKYYSVYEFRFYETILNHMTHTYLRNI